MATRLNTKFVLVLATAIICAVGVLGGLWILRVKFDAERHIRVGDDRLQAGDYRGAFKAYGRAVRKKQANLDYVDKMEQALLQIQPDNRDDASALYRSRIEILRHRLRYQGGDPQRHLDLIDECVEAARLVFDRRMWDMVGDTADAMWTQVAPSAPERIDARLYRGMASLQRVSLLAEDELDAAEDDVRAYLEVHPDSDLGWATLILGQMGRLERARGEGLTGRVGELRQAVIQSLELALQAVPDGPEVARAQVLHVVIERAADSTPVSDQQTIEAADRLLERVDGSDNPLLIADTARIMQSLAWLGYVPAAIDLLEQYLDRHPTAIVHRMLLGRCLLANDQMESARINAREILDCPWLPVSIESRLQDQMRRGAAALLVDVAYRDWELAGTEQRAALPALESAVESLRRLTLDRENDPLLLRSEGKQALAGGDFRTASARFEQVIRSGSEDMELRILAARSLERTGELGRAWEHMEELESTYGGNDAYLSQAATLAFRIGRSDRAQELVDRLLELYPGHADGRQLATALAVQRTGAPTGEVDSLVQGLMAAEAALTAGDADTARQTLLTILERQPNDLRTLEALMQVEISDGRKEQALEYLEQLLQLGPENPRLVLLRESLRFEDPVEAVRQYVLSMELGEAERAVRMVTVMTGLAAARRLRAEQLERSGRTEPAAAAREVADRADAEARRLLPAAEAAAPDDPQTLEARFQLAVVDKDWPEAEAIVVRARELDTDLAGGALFAGRLALERGDVNQAVQELADATRRLPHSSFAWRALAVAYERAGNFFEARGAYEQAYRNNPTDIETVRRHVQLLLRTGDETRALRIVRSARQLVPNDAALREIWLELEHRIGDRSLALRERRRLFQRSPDDRINAARLVATLVRTQPSPELMRDDEGQPLYGGGRWARLDTREQRRILNEVRQEWYGECESILDQLEAEGGRDVETGSLRALLLRDRGDIDGGQQVLVELADAGGPQAIDAALALARYQNEVGRSAAAERTLRQAGSIQDPQVREADAALGDFLFDQQRYGEALQAYQQATGDSVNPSLELRLIECHVRLGRLDEAREMLDARVAEGQDGFMEQMMAAAIADGHAALFLREGREQEAQLERSRRDEALRRAEAIMPSSPQPYVQRALALVRDYERAMLTSAPDDEAARRRQVALLDEALRALEQADDVQFGDAATSLTRVTVLQAMDDISGAMGELLRLLERDPDQDTARLALAELQYARGDDQAAIRTLEQGIARRPSRPAWFVALGEIHRQEALRLQQEPNPRPADAVARATEAARAFVRAAELEPSVMSIARIANLYLGTIPPQFQQAASVLEAYPQQVETSGMLRGMNARVLDGLGQREPAVEELRQSYRLSREAAEHEGSGGEEMMNWYRTLQALFRERPAAEVEAFVMEAAGQRPQLMDFRWLARRWATAGADGLSRAVELQDQAVRMSENADAATRAVMLYELGGYLLLGEQYDPAARAFARAIEVQPAYKQALNNYAYLLAVKLSRPQEALAHARRAVDLLNRTDSLPDQATLLDTLGWISFLSGDRAAAETHLRRSVERMEMASNHYHLAVVLARDGRLDAASSHLQRAAELRPDPETQAEINALADDIRTRKGRG